MSRYAAKRDDNHGEIIKAAEKIGVACIDVAGHAECGFDILMRFRGIMYAVEVKDGKKPPSAQKLTKNETTSQQKLESSYIVVNSVMDLYTKLGIFKQTK